MKAYIKAISHYLPGKIVTNNDLLKEFPEWSSAKVISKLGISERHVAEADEFSSDLAIKAGQRLFNQHNIDPETIDFIMLCTQSPDYFLPTTACIIQNKLGIPISSGAIDFNLGCSGYVYGLSLAKGLIYANIAKNILLITAETYSKFLHPKDKSNRTIFGDAATATLISTTGYSEILDFCLGTDGKGAENLIVKKGGLRHQEVFDDISYDESGNPQSSDYLYMNGSEIFSFTLEMVPKLLTETLAKNKMKFENIDFFVFHQANKYLLNFVRKKCNIPEDKFLFFIENVGNTVSSTIPLVIENAVKEKKLKGNVLIAGFGVGYSWGATILKF